MLRDEGKGGGAKRRLARAVLREPHVAAAHVVAVLSVVAMTALRLVLERWLIAPLPFITLYGAVVFSAWYGGIGPGLMSIVASLLSAAVFILPPRGLLPGPEVGVSFALFTIVSTFIVSLVHSSRRNQQVLAALATESEQRSRALRESEARVRAVLDNAVDAIIVIDEEGHIENVNPATVRMFGFEEAELKGQNVSVLMPEPYRSEHDSYLERYLTTGERRIIGIGREVLGRRRDGTVFPLDLAVSEINLEDRRVFTGTIRDVTDRKRAESEIRALNASLEQRVQERTSELREANRELEGFTYSVSHDLRAPLRSIIATCRMLKEDYGEHLDADAQQLLNQQDNAALRMAALIDDLLNYARLWRAEVQASQVDLSDIADSLAAEIQERTTTRADFKIERNLSCVCDSSLIRLALQNLLENAAKFSSRSERPLVEFGRRDGAFYVRDNGIGFDMQYAGKLFKPFERLVDAVAYPGTGIGLANVKRVVERHGGKIWAESTPGDGATFYFTLPNRQPASPADPKI